MALAALQLSDGDARRDAGRCNTASATPTGRTRSDRDAMTKHAYAALRLRCAVASSATCDGCARCRFLRHHLRWRWHRHGGVMSIQVHRLVAWSDDSIKEV
jgi:hypothetical protein